MANNLDGWANFGSFYAGNSPACSRCNSCKWFSKVDGSPPYRCECTHTNNHAASDKCHGKHPNGCKAYEQGAPGSGAQESTAKHKGTSGVVAGIAQVADGAFGGRNGQMSMDNIAEGSIKILGAGAKALFTESEEEKAAAEAREAARKAEELAELWADVNDAVFGDTRTTQQTISGLFSTFNKVLVNLTINQEVSDRKEIAGAAIAKIEEGMACLRQNGDCDPQKLDDFQIKLQKAKLRALNIKSPEAELKGSKKDATLNKIRVILESVSLDGGTKLVIKSLDLLGKVGMNLFFPYNLISGGAKIESAEKRSFCDEAISKINAGLSSIRKDTSLDPQKLARYESMLENLRKNRNGIKPVASEKLDAELFQTIIDSIELDGGSAIVEAGIKTLFWIKFVFFFPLCKAQLFVKKLFKKASFSKDEKRDLCNAAIEKIGTALEILKKDSNFAPEKIAAYEKKLAKFKLNCEGIK